MFSTGSSSTVSWSGERQKQVRMLPSSPGHAPRSWRMALSRAQRSNTAARVTSVRAEVVIAADGVESKFSKWCGIDTTVPVREIMSSVQYVMADIDIDPHVNRLLSRQRGRTGRLPLGISQGRAVGKCRDWHLRQEERGRAPGKGLPRQVREKDLPPRKDDRVYPRRCLGLPPA